MSAPFRVERRLDCPAWLNWAIPAGAVATALLAGALLLFFLGVSPGAAYKAMFKGALGDAWGVSETLVKAIPLTLAGLAVGYWQSKKEVLQNWQISRSYEPCMEEQLITQAT